MSENNERNFDLGTVLSITTIKWRWQRCYYK